MPRQYLTPASLYNSRQYDYSQVVIAEGKRHIFVAGQTAWNSDMELVGKGDFGRQLECSLANVGLALEAAGATAADIVCMRVFVVNYSADLLPVYGEKMAAFLDPDCQPANTLIGVQSLALPGFLVEIDAQAVTDT